MKSALIKLKLTAMTHLKTVVLAKTLNLHNNLLIEENAAETFYGLIHRLVST